MFSKASSQTGHKGYIVGFEKEEERRREEGRRMRSNGSRVDR